MAGSETTSIEFQNAQSSEPYSQLIRSVRDQAREYMSDGKITAEERAELQRVIDNYEIEKNGISHSVHEELANLKKYMDVFEFIARSDVTQVKRLQAIVGDSVIDGNFAQGSFANYVNFIRENNIPHSPELLMKELEMFLAQRESKEEFHREFREHLHTRDYEKTVIEERYLKESEVQYLRDLTMLEKKRWQTKFEVRPDGDLGSMSFNAIEDSMARSNFRGSLQEYLRAFDLYDIVKGMHPSVQDGLKGFEAYIRNTEAFNEEIATFRYSQEVAGENTSFEDSQNRHLKDQSSVHGTTMELSEVFVEIEIEIEERKRLYDEYNDICMVIDCSSINPNFKVGHPLTPEAFNFIWENKADFPSMLREMPDPVSKPIPELMVTYEPSAEMKALLQKTLGLDTQSLNLHQRNVIESNFKALIMFFAEIESNGGDPRYLESSVSSAKGFMQILDGYDRNEAGTLVKNTKYDRENGSFSPYDRMLRNKMAEIVESETGNTDYYKYGKYEDLFPEWIQKAWNNQPNHGPNALTVDQTMQLIICDFMRGRNSSTAKELMRNILLEGDRESLVELYKTFHHTAVEEQGAQGVVHRSMILHGRKLQALHS